MHIGDRRRPVRRLFGPLVLVALVVLALTGFISRDKNILLILGISLLYIFLYAMILFCRKRNRSLQIPYLPFLLAAYITAWMTG